MPRDLIDDKSTLVQVMAWCRQATSHYLNQCWPKYPMPYGVTRPQWVNFKTNNMKMLSTLWALSDWLLLESPKKFPEKLSFDIFFTIVSTSCWIKSPSDCDLRQYYRYVMSLLWETNLAMQKSWVNENCDRQQWEMTRSLLPYPLTILCILKWLDT